ncbi:MAG: MATE family efflux transporter [Lachnospiraceae bacterium]|nr:MATE family efflux transporter [Lachnospiraceae bacterium]
MTFREKVSMTWRLSIPAMIAQLTSIVMQYIDAAMVGHIGAEASAAIGVVASSTWLFGSLLIAIVYGFSVQISHAVGANDKWRIKNVFKQGIVVTIAFSLMLMILGAVLSGPLPHILGANKAICGNASKYFMIYAISLPICQIQYYSAAALQATGNMKIPGILESAMCFLDIIFNFFFIFPTNTYTVLGIEITPPGLGLGVTGAALGTAASQLVIAIIMFYFAAIHSEQLRIDLRDGFMFDSGTLKRAARISLPAAFEQVALTGAQIMSTGIVAPLGTVAIAANSFAVTAESLCYMPGYGLQSSASTLVGQSIGANKKRLAKNFAWITVGMGMIIMTVTAVIMYFICPFLIGFLTPDAGVGALAARVLRIELMAETFFGASIITAGALRGMGDTLAPSIMNLISIWGVRITLSYFLVSRGYGLIGVWIAMSIELTFRGIIFLIRLKTTKW